MSRLIQKQPLDICAGPLWSGVIRYTLPIIASGLLQLLFNAADLVVVGRFCGENAIASVGATGSLVNLLVNFFFGLSVGAGVCTAQAIGAENNEEAHNTIHTAIPTAIVSGLFLTVVGIFVSAPMLSLMNTPKAILPGATLYMRIYFCGMVPNIVYNFGAAILRAAGDTKRPLYYLILAGIVNVILNVFFVAVCGMSVDGVATATVMSQTLSCLLVLRNMIGRTDACRLVLSELRFHKKQLQKILRIGIPSGIQGTLFSISNVIIQSSVNLFGEAAVSGSAAASSLCDFVYIAMNSFSQTALNYTGQNLGAKRYDRLGKILAVCITLVASLGLAVGMGITLLGRQLLSIYIVDSKEAVDYGMRRLWCVAAPYFLCGIMDVTTGALRGMGWSFAPMVISIGGICVFRVMWIATVFQIPKYHQYIETVLITWPISWVITLVALLIVFVIAKKKIRKAAKAEQ